MDAQKYTIVSLNEIKKLSLVSFFESFYLN